MPLPLSPSGLQGAARILRFGDGVRGYDAHSPWEHWGETVGLRMNGPARLRQTVFVDGERKEIDIDNDAFARDRHFEPHTGMTVYFENGAPHLVSLLSPRGSAAGPASDGSLRAPMPGKIVAVPAKPGGTVAKGQPVVVLEAMKMEHALVAPFDGVVETVGVAVGDQVADGTVLATVKAPEAQG